MALSGWYTPLHPALPLERNCPIGRKQINIHSWLPCNHQFDFKCIQAWLTKGAERCPVCAIPANMQDLRFTAEPVAGNPHPWANVRPFEKVDNTWHGSGKDGDGTAKRKREIQAKKVWLAKIEQDEFVTALRGMERSEQTGRLLDIIRDDIHMTKKEIKLLRKAG